MSKGKKAAAAGETGASVEEKTAEYLRKHPDFFQRRPDLLAEMELPREDGSGTISLQERQVEVMRGQQRKLREQLETLIETARENGELERRIQDLALELIGLDGGAELMDRATALVQERFGIDYIALCTGDDLEDYADLARRVEHLGSVCDDRLPSKLVESLFGQPPDRVRSCALIPVAREKELLGVLALGSRAPDRFHPNLGAMYLDRLGTMLGALAGRG